MPRRKDKALLQSKPDKDARALTFMMERVAGRTIKQIAATYKCDSHTVDNYLAYGRRQGLVVNEARHAIAGKLIPLALAVYETRLEDGDLDAARDLLFGMGVLQKQSNVKHTTEEASDTLDGFRDAYYKAIDVLAVPRGEKRPTGLTGLPTAPSDEPIDTQPDRQSDLHDQSHEGSD